MPTANGGYYGGGGYDDYDMLSAVSVNPPWKSNGIDGATSPLDVSYQTPVEVRPSYQIGMNGDGKSEPQDEVSRHMLYETALLDTKAFSILSLDEVDALKKELARLESRTEQAQRKLALETKVRDAAQNLRRLYAARGGRVDTPQSPESPQKSRRSLNGNRQSTGSTGDSLSNAEDELATSQKKVEDLHNTIATLLDRRSYVERRLLHHTAAILAAQREQESSKNGHLDDDNVSTYEADEFDGIRDILGGKTIGKYSQRIDSGRMNQEYEEQLHSMQTRLERLNDGLRSIVEEVSRNRGIQISPEISADSDDAAAKIDHSLSRLETNVQTLEQDRQSSENELHTLNTHFHTTLSTSSAAQLPQPPQSTGHGLHEQLQYLEDVVQNVQSMVQDHQENSAALSKSAGASQKLGEYETTVHGLWEVLQADETPAHNAGEKEAHSQLPQDTFSLQAFSSRVQHFFDRASSARDQHDILRRQIAQQRDLNGKSDAEKDKQIEELQANHAKTLAAHDAMEEELSKNMASHASVENERNQLRTELANVETEFEQIRKLADQHNQEREETSKSMAILTANRDKHHEEMENLEGEVVRLTTELTMARAELDGAYGSRAERAKEAQTGEVEALKDRSATLEKELAEMTAEFQDLTRESLELDRERNQLDSLIDGLREKCENLESQLSDEKVRWLGVKSPTATPQTPDAREQTTMVVLRQEFKKMVREARAEGVRLLRAEQEERRKLETEVRRLRQASTPLAKTSNGAGTPA